MTDPAHRARLVARFGAAVAEPWLAALPALASSLAAAWSLGVADAIPAGGTSVVLRCTRADGSRALLKLTPDPALAAAEATALRAWAPTSAVPTLLAADPAAGALLLEALPTETTLRDAPGAPASPAALRGLLDRLHAVAPPPGTPPLRERVAFVFDLWTPRRPALAATRDRALALADDPAAPHVLLHGDLHPGNVIDAGPPRGLVAIDPRPCAGDPAFDAVDFPELAHLPRVAAWREALAPLLAPA